MEGQLIWKDEYNIGVDIIDQEHKRLFKIINKLFRFSDEKNKSQWACQEGIKFFKDHAVKHFTEEEEYMASIHYERLNVHMHIHSEFRERTLPALEEELEQTDYCADSVEHFLGVCAGWLVTYVDGRPGDYGQGQEPVGWASAGKGAGGSEKSHTSIDV